MKHETIDENEPTSDGKKMVAFLKSTLSCLSLKDLFLLQDELNKSIELREQLKGVMNETIFNNSIFGKMFKIFYVALKVNIIFGLYLCLYYTIGTHMSEKLGYLPFWVSSLFALGTVILIIELWFKYGLRTIIKIGEE